jgi:hypothetical protein
MKHTISPHGSICAIDPGAPPKTVFAHNAFGDGSWSHSIHWYTERKPPASLFNIVAAEKPTGVIRKGRTPAAVVSPAGWGMAALFSCSIVDGGLRLWVPMEAWKDKAYANGARTKKEVFCGWLVQDLRLTGLDPTKDRDQDMIEAIGLAETISKFSRKELTAWRVEW